MKHYAIWLPQYKSAKEGYLMTHDGGIVHYPCRALAEAHISMIDWRTGAEVEVMEDIVETVKKPRKRKAE